MDLKKRELYDVTAPNRSTSIINGRSSNVLNWDDVRLDWAYPRYKKMRGNFWHPDEIDMGKDKRQFETTLEPHEKDTYLKIIGLLSFLDSIQSDYSSKVADYLTDSSVNAIMIMLAREEVIHNQSYSYVLSSITDQQTQNEVFEYWKHDEVLLERNGFIADGYNDFVKDPTPANLLKSIVYDVILEGVFFYAGFAFFYNLARNQKMVGTSTMINYINRDEQLHVDTFCKIFRQILADFPELDTPELEEFAKATLTKAAELEIKWGEYIIGNRFEGISMEDLSDYIKFIAGKRSKELGYERIFPEYRTNPLRWIKAYEDADLGKSDFFEQRSRTYQQPTEDNGFDDLV